MKRLSLNKPVTFAVSVKKSFRLKRIKINHDGNGIWNMIVYSAKVAMKRRHKTTRKD